MVKPIIPLVRPQKYEFDLLDYIDCTCYNTPGKSTLGNYVIKILRLGSDMSEEWIIFMDLV